jgi:protein-S-isoprenylcysteine O-methyltransferase Ste14
MKATAFEVKFRWAIQAVIYVLGFVAVPLALRISPDLKVISGFNDKSTWLVLSSLISRQGWLTFSAATIVLLVVALLLTGLGAWLRTWGAASRGPGVGADGSVAASGAYRHSRSPLGLGMMLHALGIALLMPPGGAVFAVALIWLFQVRLALAEEAKLVALGAPYAAYVAAVPRFLPSPAAQVGASGARPNWMRAVADPAGAVDLGGGLADRSCVAASLAG